MKKPGDRRVEFHGSGDAATPGAPKPQAFADKRLGTLADRLKPDTLKWLIRTWVRDEIGRPR